MDPLIDQAQQKSIELLQHNLTKYGFQAAPVNPEKPSYSRVFGRDGAICVLGALSSRDQALLQGAMTTLQSLAKMQSPVGQIPCTVDADKGDARFWFPGNLDSTLWWTLAALKAIQLYPNQKQVWQPTIDRAMFWLRSQDTAEIGLLNQDYGSDWADEMPRHGIVLYTNALWYKVITEYLATLGPSPLISAEQQQRTAAAFNGVFWPYQKQDLVSPNLKVSIDFIRADIVRAPFYLSYISRKAYGRHCDIYGNILAMLFGLAGDEQSQIINEFLYGIDTSNPYPGRSQYPVIYPGEPEWQSIMATRSQNHPHQYHNGGIWPFIGGFWTTYVALNQPAQALFNPEQEVLKLAQANQVNDWQFNEYFHGQTGKPMGIKHQSWNAATYLLAHQALTTGQSLLNLPQTTIANSVQAKV